LTLPRSVKANGDFSYIPLRAFALLEKYKQRMTALRVQSARLNCHSGHLIMGEFCKGLGQLQINMKPKPQNTWHF
jgi:cytochrome c